MPELIACLDFIIICLHHFCQIDIQFPFTFIVIIRWWLVWNWVNILTSWASSCFRSPLLWSAFCEKLFSMVLTFSLVILVPHPPHTQGEQRLVPSGSMGPLHVVQFRVSKLDFRSLGSLHRGHSQKKFQLSWISCERSILPAKKVVYFRKTSSPSIIGAWALTQILWSSRLKTLVLTMQEWFMVARTGCSILSIPLPSPPVTAHALVLTIEIYLHNRKLFNKKYLKWSKNHLNPLFGLKWIIFRYQITGVFAPGGCTKCSLCKVLLVQGILFQSVFWHSAFGAKCVWF